MFVGYLVIPLPLSLSLLFCSLNLRNLALCFSARLRSGKPPFYYLGCFINFFSFFRLFFSRLHLISEASLLLLPLFHASQAHPRMSLYPTSGGPAALTSVESLRADDAPAPALAVADPSDGPRQPNAVFVNVYDVIESNSWLWSVGLGVHHAGIQVYEKEYQYGRCEEGTGVDTVEPRHSPPHTFREQFYIGQTDLSELAVEELVDSFRHNDLWQGRRYNLVKHNCIDFTHELSRALLSPAVRVAQMRSAVRVAYESPYTETVEVDGVQYNVPVLIPPHVDRLCRYALNYLPESALLKLDSMDNPFPPA